MAKSIFKLEVQLHNVLQAILRGEEEKEAALLLIHLENRVGGKLITIILALGAETYQRHIELCIQHSM